MREKSRPEKPVNSSYSVEPDERSFADFDDAPAPVPAPLPRRDWFGLILRLAVVVALIEAGLIINRHLLLIEQHLSRQSERDIEHDFWIICHKGSQAEDRTVAFKRLVAFGNQDWRNANLRYLKLESLDLSELTFKDVNFESSNFKGADFREAKFFKCGFDMCILTKANLKLADCSESGMFKVDLTDANLELSKLRKVDLSQSTIRNANLMHCDLTGAAFELADLTGSDLRNADLTEVDLSNAKLIRTNLATTIMPRRPSAYEGTDFTDSNWWRTQGLPVIIETRLRRKFAPTKKAPKGYYDDYQLWIKTAPKTDAPP